MLGYKLAPFVLARLGIFLPFKSFLFFLLLFSKPEQNIALLTRFLSLHL